jgi:hypothetical protein
VPIRRRLKSLVLKKRCIHGHFNRERGLGVQDHYPEVDQFITILRDPLEIHLSNYFYLKKLKENAFSDGQRIEMAVDPAYDLKRYLEESKKSFMLLHFPRELTMDNYREILSRHFVYIGITEDLQTSVDQLATKLGFPSVEVPVVNVSPRSEETPDGAREEFIHNNHLEYLVYEYALEQYRE